MPQTIYFLGVGRGATCGTKLDDLTRPTRKPSKRLRPGRCHVWTPLA